MAFPVSKEAAAQIKQAVLDEYFGRTPEKQGRDYDFAELERDAVNPFDLGEEPKIEDKEAKVSSPKNEKKEHTSIKDRLKTGEASVNRVTGGVNLITTDKLYIMYDKVAASPNKILLGEDYMDKLVQQTIEVRNTEFHGHYELAIPEIIIDLSRMIPEKYQDEAYRRLVQYFAMKLY